MEKETAAIWVELDSIKPWKENPRDNTQAIDEVAKSIKRFGFASPIIARKETGEIIAGHTRYKAAQALNLEKVPVRFLDLDPADSKLLALADNRIGEISDWDDHKLAEILSELKAEGAVLDGLGWDEDELAEIIGLGVESVAESEPEEQSEPSDQIPEDVPAVTVSGEVIQLGKHSLHCGDCIEIMKSIPDNSIDAICSDPPYGLGFMGKDWDCSVPGEDFAREALRVLKPGGHLIAFAATRTVHRLAVALEDSGFEIRDQIAWLNWQGFPKSKNLALSIDKGEGYQNRGRAIPTASSFQASDKQRKNKLTSNPVGPYKPKTKDAKKWNGWGTALKPSQEPAILARKPLEGTVAENVLKWGTGGLNIDACRYAYGDPAWPGPNENPGEKLASWSSDSVAYGKLDYNEGETWNGSDLGRWPANIYYCPKPSRKEREAGCEELPGKSGASAVERKAGSAGVNNPRAGAGRTADHVKNFHPTVKPVSLMKWLVRLITPKNGTVLEPFAGSGTTILAAESEGVVCFGIERDPKYCDIIRARYGGSVETE